MGASVENIMGFEFPWRLREDPSLLCKYRSYAVLTTVLAFSKCLFAFRLNKITVANRDKLLDLIKDKSRPLITVANHRSNLDDPLVWALFTWREIFSNLSRIRYTLAAHNICFTNNWYTRFFSLGRCVPVVRGAGVHQRGVDFCIEKLAQNAWIHVFPEGRVTPDPIRIKWGVARLVMECPKPPVVLPIWIKHMADVWPSKKPYYPRFGNDVSVTVGKELDMKEYLPQFAQGSEIDRRKKIADFIQDSLFQLGKSVNGFSHNLPPH
ncbi:hypothetical protein AB6A40_001467 [Gnathostoma spinigerum]|uniref:Tafazzin family protein n=1 Tax=Gnathostoma spinigerum TaxID=75299 RepID=A0ABD6ED46_9BILA